MKKLVIIAFVLCSVCATAQVKKAYTPRSRVYFGDTLECVIMIKDTRQSNLIRKIDTSEHIVSGFEIVAPTGAPLIFLDPSKKLYPRYIKIRKL
jgi:hypothetical protein